MNPQYWQAAAAIIAAYAALFGGIYAVVTAPLLRTIKAEVSATEARMKLQMAELKTEIKTGTAELKTEMGAMESRLNQRIDTRLVHR